MKRTIYFILAVCLIQTIHAQSKIFEPKLAIKWAPTGLILGDLSLQGEYNFLRKSSLTAKIGIPINRSYRPSYDGNDAKLNMKSLSFLAGYRRYFSKQHMKGFYLEPFFTYAHHSSDGIGTGKLDNHNVTMNFSNDYNGAGIGVQMGTPIPAPL